MANARTCWEWCTLKHDHVFTSSAPTWGTKRIHMTPEEKAEFFHKTGRRVEYRDEKKAVFRSTGLRDAEKGEDCYERFDALKECAESGKPLDKRHTLGNLDLFGDYAKMKPFDSEDRYRYHVERLKRERSSREES